VVGPFAPCGRIDGCARPRARAVVVPSFPVDQTPLRGCCHTRLRRLLFPGRRRKGPAWYNRWRLGLCSSHQTAWHGARKCLDRQSVGLRRPPRLSGTCLSATRHAAGTGYCGAPKKGGGGCVHCTKRAPTGKGPNSAVASSGADGVSAT